MFSLDNKCVNNESKNFYDSHYIRDTYIHNNIDSKIADVPDHAGLLRGNLGVLDKLGQVFLADPVLGQDVEEDNSDLVVYGHILVQEDGDDVLHVILDLLSLSVSSHGQILLNFAELVDVTL